MKRKLLSMLLSLTMSLGIGASSIYVHAEDKTTSTKAEDKEKDNDKKDDDKNDDKKDDNKNDDKKDDDKKDDNKKDDDKKDDDKKSDDDVKELGDGILSFTIKIDGVVYKLPSDYKNLEKNGWELDNVKDDAKVAPNQYTGYVHAINDDKIMEISFINYEEGDSLPLEDTQVNAVKLSSENFYYKDKKMPEFELPGKINQDSTIDDVIQAYGEPKSKDEYSQNISLAYEKSYYERVTFNFNKESKKITKMEMFYAAAKKNETNDDDKKKDNSNNDEKDKKDDKKVSDEVPEEIKNYQEPKEVSDDFTKGQFKLEGKIYDMPVPVSVLEKDGWKAEDLPEKLNSKEETSSRVTLKKDKKAITVTLINYSDKAQKGENTWVASIKTTESMEKTEPVELELPFGLKIGMSHEELKDIVDNKIKEKSLKPLELTNTIEYSGTFDMDTFLIIKIDKKTKKVIGILFANDPPTLDAKKPISR